MSTTSTDTAVYNPTDDTLSTSRFLSSSIETLSPSRNHNNSRITKTYKQARDLFLTRRLPEAYTTIEPLVTPASASDENLESEEDLKTAPISTASRSQRVKIWSLYLTLLNAIHELGPEEGKAHFGSKEWRNLTSKAYDGSIWDEVVDIGYGGVEGSVDADVVINLATLLLAQSPSQTANQERLEAYLSASNEPSLDLPSHLSSASRTDGLTASKKHKNGTDTPRDLASRVKILELYALHVLPRNEEWDYAQDFIKMSEVLDEDTRDAFLTSLQDLQEQEHGTSLNGEEIPRDKADENEQQLQELEPRHEIEPSEPPDIGDHTDDSEATLQPPPRSKPQRTYSEHDYGIETPKASSSIPQPSNSPAQRPPQSRTARSPPITSRKKSSSTPPSLYKRSAAILLNLQNLITNMTQSLSKNPMALLRFVFFIVGLVVALSRRDVKDRVARGWDKVRQTIGMGVKVSYI